MVVAILPNFFMYVEYFEQRQFESSNDLFLFLKFFPFKQIICKEVSLVCEEIRVRVWIIKKINHVLPIPTPMQHQIQVSS